MTTIEYKPNTSGSDFEARVSITDSDGDQIDIVAHKDGAILFHVISDFGMVVTPIEVVTDAVIWLGQRYREHQKQLNESTTIWS